MRRSVLLLLCLGLAVVCARSAQTAPLSPSADPVTAFITAADSLDRTGGDGALAGFVKENEVLVGASVAKLLDAAFVAGSGGDAAAEKENVNFARRIATAHQAQGGSAVALSLVDTHAGWTAAQRKLRAQAMQLEADAAETRKAGDIPGAVEKLNQARSLYEKIKDRHSVAVNWGTMGVTHWPTGEWDVVIADYEQALAARRAVENRILEGRTLNGLGTAWQQKAQWDKAAEYYGQAIDLRTRTGDLPGLGTSITYLGHVYNSQGRYVQARDEYERALPILEAQGNAAQMVELSTGIAAVNAAMGRIEDSNTAYRRGIALAQANQLGGHEMLCRRNLADNLRRQGRYTEALEETDAARALLAANPNPGEEMLLHETRGLTYMAMGELDAAREDLVKVSEMASAAGEPGAASAALTNVGYLYRDLGASDRGLKSADQAIALAEQAGDGRRYRNALILRADLEMRQGRYDDALATWKEALAQDEADQAAGEALVDEIGMAGAVAGLGQADAARTQLRGLVTRAEKAGLPEVEWSALFAIGHTYEKQDPDSAEAWYERALTRLEVAGEDVSGGEIQTEYLSGRRRGYYEEVARFYGDTYATTRDRRWSDASFRTIERAKARGLLDMLRASVAATPSKPETDALDALYSLDASAADYSAKRAELEKQYVELRRARVGKAISGFQSGGVVGLDAAMRALPKKSLLLEYALGDSASQLWIIDRNGSELVTLPRRAELEGSVRRLRDAVANVEGGSAALRATARELYTTLLGPAAARLRGAETLIIVPDGGLFELPFEALLSADATANAAWSSLAYVARTHAVVYAPSAAVYVSLKSGLRQNDFNRDLLAVGNPDFTTLAAGSELAPLPHAEAEVAAIGTRVKESRRVVLTGTGATEAGVKQELAATPPRIVHLATHGLVDPNDPSRSSVALAAGDGEDGYLHTLEILATRMPCELVVMSACESARGRVSRGEGVVGLSRAFLAAGAESVVASLWAVSDESTADLMQVFYEKMMGKKHTAARALKEARVALIDGGSFAHPFYWSPFVVTGTERSPWK